MDDKAPKPLMKIRGEQTLIRYFLDHVQDNYFHQPKTIYVLCDTDQVPFYKSELKFSGQSFNLEIYACGQTTSTYQKFSWAIENICESKELLHFTYPDIFHSCQSFQKSGHPCHQNVAANPSPTLSVATRYKAVPGHMRLDLSLGSARCRLVT